MAEDNLPSGTVDTPPAIPSQEEILGEIADLIDDSPPENPIEDHEDAAEPGEEDDPLGLEADAEDVDGTDAAEESDGQQEVKGGRFAPDTAKVTLNDGTVISVADLKRDHLYQRDYTQKGQALAEEKKAFDAEKDEFSQYAQSLNQTRDYLAWYAETYLPKQPEPFSGAPDDYVGFIDWQKKNAEWQVHAQAYQAFQQLKQQDEEKQQGETVKQAQTRMQAERQKLLDAIPVLKDPAKGKQVWGNIVTGAQQHYGISEAEVNSVGDHRMLKVLRDALAYRQLKAKAPTVKAEVAKRPVNPGKRQPPQAQVVKGRQDRLERLKRNPSLENGAASLMDFDL